ncbi:MAG: hypothetical protein EA402_12180 [Planctomycetota bacterium]|nr:MAG: hypothetical protein EA402_12180 [Planctomycetota bacterium]
MLFTAIALAVAVSALILAIIAKGDRPAQICCTIVIILAALVLLEDEVRMIDRALNRTVRAGIGIGTLALALTAAIRVKHQITGTVLVTCAALMAGVLCRIL